MNNNNLISLNEDPIDLFAKWYESAKKTEKGQERHNFRCFSFGSFQPPFRISGTGSQAIKYGSKC